MDPQSLQINLERAWNLERLHGRRNPGYAFLMLQEVGALSASSEIAFELS
jgi:hypothetical protein